MKTVFHYIYRDADNYKQGHTVILDGVLTFDQIKPHLDSDGFIPDDVGLPELQCQMESFPSVDDDEGEGLDHVWHEIDEHDFTSTEDDPTSDLTADQLLAKFKAAKWDVVAAVERLGL